MVAVVFIVCARDWVLPITLSACTLLSEERGSSAIKITVAHSHTVEEKSQTKGEEQQGKSYRYSICPSSLFVPEAEHMHKQTFTTDTNQGMGES